MPETSSTADAAKSSGTPGTTPTEAPKRPGMDDDVVGKVYDRHLSARLLRYLKPYTLQAVISGISILFKAACDVAGPYFIKVAFDTYFAPAHHPGWLARHLSPAPLTGVEELSALYLSALALSFCLEFVQTYLMQWTGQKIMFDLRREIFRHIQQLHIAFFDRTPVGRLVTRVTSDVDALNEMFTSGVLAIFEDVFALSFIIAIMLVMSWPLALLTLAVIPGIAYATKLFRDHVRDSYRRQRAATAKINSFTQEYVSGMAVVQLFNRERRAFKDFSAVNLENKIAWTDAIFAYALYYPVVELLSSTAIALVIWRGGLAVLNAKNFDWLKHHIYLVPGSTAPHFSFIGNTVSIGVLIAFIQYAQRFFRPIQDLSDKYNILQAAMAAAERVFKLLDTEPEIRVPAQPIAGTRSGRIEFRNVWFTYQQLTPKQTAALTAFSAHDTTDLSSRPKQSEVERPASAPEQTAALTAFSARDTTDLSSRPKRSEVERPASAPAHLHNQHPPNNLSSFAAGGGSASAPAHLKDQHPPTLPPELQDIEWILRGVSFTVEPDETAAIVGHTGAGKTTITALMMRFYDVQSGQVLVDDVDVREQDLLSLRRRFGVVLQDPFLFSGTIAQNIRLGSTWITDDEVANAAEEVNVADFIRTLPNQFAEPVLERGSTLSTGQKQLISFARALAHRPGILILDEATSSVDTETEQLVSSALARMITGRTSVLIAHRLSTVQRADTILVMHKGQLREQGNHQQLLALRGLYYKLYQLQYRDQELAAAD
jgi:ATP-binding cassette subfamily B protein